MNALSLYILNSNGPFFMGVPYFVKLGKCVTAVARSVWLLIRVLAFSSSFPKSMVPLWTLYT